MCVCALVLCKFTSDEPESANDSAGYFKKAKFPLGIWKGWEIGWLFSDNNKDGKWGSSAERRAKPNTITITKSLSSWLLPSHLTGFIPSAFQDKNFLQK